MKMRLKPLEVNAVQFNPNLTPWPPGVRDLRKTRKHRVRGTPYVIETIAGLRPVNPGDWIITLPNGSIDVNETDVVRELYELTEGEWCPRCMSTVIFDEGSLVCTDCQGEYDARVRRRRRS